MKLMSNESFVVDCVFWEFLEGRSVRVIANSAILIMTLCDNYVSAFC